MTEQRITHTGRGTAALLLVLVCSFLLCSAAEPGGPPAASPAQAEPLWTVASAATGEPLLETSKAPAGEPTPAEATQAIRRFRDNIGWANSDGASFGELSAAEVATAAEWFSVPAQVHQNRGEEAIFAIAPIGPGLQVEVIGITYLRVNQGGTGRGSATPYMPITGGTTSTGVQQSVAASGSVGDVLQYNGAAALPTWVAPTAGAPTTAHYLTSQAESGLSAEVNLGALTTGMLKHTVSGSVSTPATAVEGTDYYKPGGTDVAAADGGLGASSLTGLLSANGASAATAYNSFTDNHVPRANSTGKLEDTAWIIGDTGVLYYTDSGNIPFAVGGAGNVTLLGDTSSEDLLYAEVLADANHRLIIDASGKLTWGSGSATGDTVLFRSAANLLALSSGDALVIGATAGNHASSTAGTLSYNSTTGQMTARDASAYRDLSSGYTLPFQCLSYNPANGASDFIGANPIVPAAAANTRKIFITRAGTITAAELWTTSGGLPGAQNWSWYIRLNDTTDTLIQTVATSAGSMRFTNSALSIAVASGDYIEIKSVNPTWAPGAPTGVTVSGYVRIQ